jgi:hypothetical protein
MTDEELKKYYRQYGAAQGVDTMRRHFPTAEASHGGYRHNLSASGSGHRCPDASQPACLGEVARTGCSPKSKGA